MSLSSQSKRTLLTVTIMLRPDVGSHSPEDTTLHPSSLESSTSLLWEHQIPYIFPFKFRLP